MKLSDQMHVTLVFQESQAGAPLLERYQGWADVKHVASAPEQLIGPSADEPLRSRGKQSMRSLFCICDLCPAAVSFLTL